MKTVIWGSPNRMIDLAHSLFNQTINLIIIEKKNYVLSKKYWLKFIITDTSDISGKTMHRHCITTIIKCWSYVIMLYSTYNSQTRNTESESIQKLTNGRNGCDDLAKLELVEDGSLTSSIKTNHQNSHFFLGEKPTEKLRECQPHFSFWLLIPTHLHAN